MKYYHFERLIKKYSSDFIAIIPAKGSYSDDGEYIEGKEKKLSLTGAILDIDEKKLYNSINGTNARGGTLTTKDKQLYITDELTENLVGAKVKYKGHVYSIEDEKEDCEFTGFCSYILTYVSAFKEG